MLMPPFNRLLKLAAAGCDIVVGGLPRQEDAGRTRRYRGKAPFLSLPTFTSNPPHFCPAIDAGCAAVRVNPGNIREFDGRVKEVATAACAAHGSLSASALMPAPDKRLPEKYGKATPEALVESALWEAGLSPSMISTTSPFGEAPRPRHHGARL